MKKNLLLTFLVGFLANVSSSAQVVITDLAIPYTQDFNTLASTGTTNTILPTGWGFAESGTGANTTYAADNGTVNSGNTYSYGGTSASERAFGVLRSGTVVSNIGANFSNNSPAVINEITVTYTGEQWRLGGTGRTDKLDFQYSLDATSLATGTWFNVDNLDFITPNSTGTIGAYDGNLSANRSTKTFTITGLNIAAGSSFWIRWTDADVSGADDGLSVDDFSLAFNGTVIPACTEPTAQPTGLLLTPFATTVSGTFTASTPAADEYIVVRSISATLSSQPVDGISYTNGASLGGGTVVTSGTSLNFTDQALSPSTTYNYFVFSSTSDNCSGGPNYLTTGPLTGSTTTQPLAACVTPPAAPTNLSLLAGNTSVSGSFTGATNANRYLVVRSNDNTAFTPTNGTLYSPGQFFGNDTVVSFGTSLSFNASGLTLNTLYYFFVYAANGDCSGEPVYNTTALTGNVTTTNSTGIPPNYYAAATGLTCQPLKTALKNIITANTDTFTYTPGVWTIYQYSDLKRNDDNTADVIWDMYSDNPAGPDPYTYTFGTNQCGTYNSEADCYNREHSFPQSWFSDSLPMRTDVHHVFPTDGYVNNIRNNFPFGEVATYTDSTRNGSLRGLSVSPGYTGTVFEPIDAYKGDLARAQLYMAVRYEDRIGNWYTYGNANQVLLSPTDEPDADKRKLQVYDTWFLQLLFKWHDLDPVSTKEVNRNNAIFYQVINDNGVNKVQGNRNPFIDNPQYANMIFQCTGVVPITVIDFNASVVNNSVLLKWYATFETNFNRFVVERSTDGVSFTAIGEVRGRNLADYHFIDNNLPSKNILYYRLRLVDSDASSKYGRTISIRLNNEINSVLVYPNPTAGNLNITLAQSLESKSTLQIMDLAGRVLVEKQLATGSIQITEDVSSLTAGRYFLRITNKEQTINQSFVVVK